MKGLREILEWCILISYYEEHLTGIGGYRDVSKVRRHLKDFNNVILTTVLVRGNFFQIRHWPLSFASSAYNGKKYESRINQLFNIV